MAQQNLTLRIDVSAQDAAAKVQQVTQAFKDLGMTFISTDVRVNALGRSLTNAVAPKQAGIDRTAIAHLTGLCPPG